MRPGNIVLIGGLALAVASAIFALTGSGGSASSLRGATELALFKTVVHATKTVNRRRLENTKVDCKKIKKFMDDSNRCIYGQGRGGKAINDCVGDAIVAGKALPAKGIISANTVSSNANALNAEHITFPQKRFERITSDVVGICANGRGRKGNKHRATQEIDDIDLDDIDWESLTQAEFHAIVMEYVEAEIIPLCEDFFEAENPEVAEVECNKARLAVEEVLVTAELGDNDEEEEAA